MLACGSRYIRGFPSLGLVCVCIPNGDVGDEGKISNVLACGSRYIRSFPSLGLVCVCIPNEDVGNEGNLLKFLNARSLSSFMSILA